MSFFDGIVNGVKSVFGIDSSPEPSKRVVRPEAPERGDQMAADTPTAFERAAGTRSGGSSFGPTLAERIRAATPAGPAPSSPPATRTSIPPHLLGQRQGTPPAESTPVADASAAAAQATGTAVATATTTAARARVRDASTNQVLGTVDELVGNDPAAAAARNVQTGIDYFARTFGRNGVDGAGAGVEVLINDRSLDEQGRERFAGNGGYYATTYSDGTSTEAIHFGVGKTYDAERGRVEQHEMLYADDLAIHELTHGIIRKETGHLGGGADEAGATNEALADVMAAAATRDWRMGEGMYSERSDYRLMRNIANPDDPRAIHGLWTSMGEVRERQQRGEEVEEHWASGVISTAAYRVQQRFGGEAGWGVVERVFYDSIDSNRLGSMSFQEVANGLRASAAAVYGEGSSVAQVFDEELRRAEL